MHVWEVQNIEELTPSARFRRSVNLKLFFEKTNAFKNLLESFLGCF